MLIKSSIASTSYSSKPSTTNFFLNLSTKYFAPRLPSNPLPASILVCQGFLGGRELNPLLSNIGKSVDTSGLASLFKRYLSSSICPSGSQ